MSVNGKSNDRNIFTDGICSAWEFTGFLNLDELFTGICSLKCAANFLKVRPRL
jgi:hypothetical protein